MDREILFRGKREDNGEWVYGMLAYFFDKQKNSMIMPSCYFGTRDMGAEDDNGNPIIEDQMALGGFINVIPETVGQFTGLTDKNGKKIFERDINYDGGYVFYCKSLASFRIQYRGHSVSLEYTDEVFQIIGNIQDNPELLQ